jgi:hypothetical protein
VGPEGLLSMSEKYSQVRKFVGIKKKDVSSKSAPNKPYAIAVCFYF